MQMLNVTYSHLRVNVLSVVIDRRALAVSNLWHQQQTQGSTKLNDKYLSISFTSLHLHSCLYKKYKQKLTV